MLPVSLCTRVSVSLAQSAAKPNPFGGELASTQYGPSPLHLGSDIRKWLRKHSNGYQIFGKRLSFPGQAMCLGEMESLIITWPCDRPKVALFPPGKKKKRNVPASTVMWMRNHAGGDGSDATFQMFAMTVHRQHREAERFCSRPYTRWLALFLHPFFKCWGLPMAVQWLRTENNWRSAHLFSVSEMQLHGCVRYQMCVICLNASHTRHFTILCITQVKPGPKWGSAHPPPASEPCMKPEWT